MEKMNERILLPVQCVKTLNSRYGANVEGRIRMSSDGRRGYRDIFRNSCFLVLPVCLLFFLYCKPSLPSEIIKKTEVS